MATTFCDKSTWDRRTTRRLNRERKVSSTRGNSLAAHIVYAVGYEPAPLPDLYVDRQRINGSLRFDMITSGFRTADQVEDEVVAGLFGCGIAFPEQVADPEGHVEAAVGVTKFFKFAQRVRDVWAG
jgi:hypothetical protein